MAEPPKFGPTGEFPDGKLGKWDEGGFAYGVAADNENNLVVLNFGTPVCYLAMHPDEAVKFAESLIKAARKLTVVTLKI